MLNKSKNSNGRNDDNLSVISNHTDNTIQTIPEYGKISTTLNSIVIQNRSTTKNLTELTNYTKNTDEKINNLNSTINENLKTIQFSIVDNFKFLDNVINENNEIKKEFIQYMNDTNIKLNQNLGVIQKLTEENLKLNEENRKINEDNKKHTEIERNNKTNNLKIIETLTEKNIELNNENKILNEKINEQKNNEIVNKLRNNGKQIELIEKIMVENSNLKNKIEELGNTKKDKIDFESFNKEIITLKNIIEEYKLKNETNNINKGEIRELEIVVEGYREHVIRLEKTLKDDEIQIETLKEDVSKEKKNYEELKMKYDENTKLIEDLKNKNEYYLNEHAKLAIEYDKIMKDVSIKDQEFGKLYSAYNYNLQYVNQLTVIVNNFNQKVKEKEKLIDIDKRELNELYEYYRDRYEGVKLKLGFETYNDFLEQYETFKIK